MLERRISHYEITQLKYLLVLQSAPFSIQFISENLKCLTYKENHFGIFFQFRPSIFEFIYIIYIYVKNNIVKIEESLMFY